MKVYSQYNDAQAATGLSSDVVLFQTIDVAEPYSQNVLIDFVYDDLKNGITIGGQNLPASDYDLAVGANWKLTFARINNDGTEESIPGVINIAVLSPYAGLYEVTSSGYFRIGVESSLGPWNGEQRFIGSVDEITFLHEYVGPLFTTTYGVSPWTFTVDFDTNIITAPSDPDEILIGDEQRNCIDNPGDFVNAPCAGSNILIPDNVGGKHIIKLTYGYAVTTDPANNGVREFYEVLEKI